MSYLVLARKWRPRTFDTLVGQDHVVRALTHALDSGRLHHAWLFTGTRGVGKTTLSRILAKSLNCIKGVSATPCGECQACTEIDAGRFVDYIELDAASNRGVDEMTQLLEQAVYAPSSGRYKVYMIDEVHMLSGHAFNAMLKTLEEPPPHVKFILATTDPQKIPVTVLSRCLQFNLKQMTVPAIVGHLRAVFEHESIPAETQALRLIAQAASGSMRDALSLADQAISFSAGNLDAAAVSEMLGALDQGHLLSLLRALAAADAAAVVAVADSLLARGLSFQAALADLAVLLSKVAIAQRLGHAQSDEPLADDIQALAKALAPDELQLFYTVAVHSRHELNLAPDEYAGFVMACLRMLALLPPERVPPVITGSSSESTPSSAPMSEPEPEQAQAVQAAQEVQAVQTAQVAGPAADPVAKQLPSSPSMEPGNSALPAAPTEQLQAKPAPAEIASTEPASADPGPAKAAPARTVSAKPEPAESVPAEPASTEYVSAAPAPTVQADGIAFETEPGEMAPVQTDQPDQSDRPDKPDQQMPVSFDVPADAVSADADWVEQVPVFEDDYPDTEEMQDLAPDLIAQVASENMATTSTVQFPDPAAMTSAEWPAVAAALPLSGAAQELAMNSEWLSGDEHQIRLRIGIQTLAKTGGHSRLCTVLSEYFGRVLRLHVEHGLTGDSTAQAVDQAARQERQQQAENAAEQDPLVQDLMQRFSARMVPGSVRPPAQPAV